MSSTAIPKPSLPESYVVPKVWKPVPAQGGLFGNLNSPVSGARTVKALPKGSHDLQLYSLGTPNGIKVTILLEELGVDYDAYTISIMDQDQFGSDFVAINPNSKIPAMLDYSFSPPVRVFESVSIMLYVDENGKFTPKDVRLKAEMMNWLVWQVGTAPYIGGGFGHFYKYAPVHIEYAIDRFTMETKRILDVLDKHLEGKKFMVGDQITLADLAIMPWIRCVNIESGYDAGEFLEFISYKNVVRWVASLESRDAIKRGLRVNGYGADALKERHSAKDFE